MNVGRTWWKATQKVLEHYLQLTQCMLPEIFKNRHRLKFCSSDSYNSCTVNQQILAAIKFGVSQNIVIYVNLAAIKFGVSPRPVHVVYDRRICWRRQILAKTRNSPNSPNIIARQNLLIYSNSCWNKHCYIIMRISVVCPSRIGCRSVWLKGTSNGSGLLPSPQPLYAIAKSLKWQSTSINNFKVRKN